ncbi:mechanosensitive ion channel protein MscS [Chryseobacterium sp. CBo1]|uniref:Mechanosensitive ion channel family protein n=1 Tax=Candidatus Chryseobacterium massiliense TaxID=204089 RepID=A0A3D9B128_9FLAO|nr:mechanosensitive ion channel protein MscS [Chryseobacterium sp. CBo1]REC46946.1 mechanosensitive ion channel family protein [Candidatus Chryseobacterium massiliae]
MDLDKAIHLINEKLELWFRALIKILPNLALAVIIFLIGLYISKWLRKLSERIISKFTKNITITRLFSTFIYLFSIGIIFFTALSILKLDKAVTSILAGAGIVGLALAFAFQDIAANFISGIFISFRRPLKVGDIVSIKDYMGKVEEINLRDTVILTFQGKMVIIPNKDVFQNPIENYSILGKRRFDLEVGVSYNDDLEKAAQLAIDAVKNIEGISSEDDVTLFYKEFGESSVNFTIRIWCNSSEQLQFLKVGHLAIIAIKKSFDQNKISIPFPIRTLDVAWPEKF